MRWTEKWLDVPRFIARPAAFAALWHLIFVAAVTIIKSGTNALFLSRADPKQLPLLYVAVALAVTAATALSAHLLARRSASRVLVLGISGAAGVLTLATIAAALKLPYSAGLVYVLGEAAATTGSVLFWARVSDAFQARDQKKVVGLVGAGGMLGAAIGGLLMRLLAVHTGVIAPMLLAALLWVVSLPLLRVLRGKNAPKTLGKKQDALLPALGYLTTRGYPIIVASLVVLLAALGAGTDFVFRTAAAHAYTEEEMAGVFGLLNTAVGLIVVVFQISLTSRLLTRVGVFVFVAIVPTILAVASTLSLITGTDASFAFGLVLVMKGTEMAGAYSLNQTGVALLYNPMPPEIRSQVRTLIDGAIKKAGAAACGLVLGALAAFRPELVGPGLVGVTAALVLVLLPVLRGRYLRALDHKLGGERTRFRGGGIDPSDRITQRVLRQALLSGDVDRASAALDALGPSYELSSEEMAHLLAQHDDALRAQALAHAPRMPDPALLLRLIDMAQTRASHQAHVEAIRALARMHHAHVKHALATYLDDDDPAVVTAAIEGCILNVAPGEDIYREAARTRLEQILADLVTRTPAWRREVARLLGVLEEPRYDAALARLIDDGDPAVRGLAIDAAGRERHIAHLDLLIDHLGDRDVRSRATAAIVKYGDAAVPALSKVLDDKSKPVRLRVSVPRVLMHIGSSHAARALLFSNPRDDAYLQQRIAEALAQLHERHPEVYIDKKRCNAAVRRRLVAFRAYDDALRDLRADPQLPGLLVRVVADRRKQNLKMALDVLGLHRGMVRMQAVYEGLVSSDGALRHDALELLDAQLQGDALHDELLGLLERKSEPTTTDHAHRCVLGLTTSKDPLVRAVAQRAYLPLQDTARHGAPTVVMAGDAELEGDDMDKGLVERLFVLEHVDLFEGLSTDDLSAIAEISREKHAKPSELLYEEGDTSTQMYIIVEGEVQLSRGDRPVMTLSSGESAGQVSFLDRGPRPVTARVNTQRPATLLVIERDIFMDLLADRPGLMHAFFGVLAQRLRALLEREDPAKARVTTAV